MATAVNQSIPHEHSRLSIWPRWSLWAGGLILIGLAGYFYFNKALINLRVRFAEEQTAIFEDMREQAERSDDASQGVGCLEYVVSYYPSGTKQIAGSPLDQIVERARRCAVRDIIAGLRKKTRQEFGDDPQSWIDGLKEVENSRH